MGGCGEFFSTHPIRATLRTPGMEIASNRPRAHVLVLPGGKPVSTSAARPWHLSALRMTLLTESLRSRLSMYDITVGQVHYTYRGWNGDRMSPVHDALHALDEVRRRRGDVRIGLVGHSMGGRVAAHLAAQPGVGAVVALAPWWPEDDGALVPPERRLLVVHGTADTRCDPRVSAVQTAQARGRGVDAQFRPLAGGGHFLLTKPGWWHAVTAEFLRESLAPAGRGAGGDHA